MTDTPPANNVSTDSPETGAPGSESPASTGAANQPTAPTNPSAPPPPPPPPPPSTDNPPPQLAPAPPSRQVEDPTVDEMEIAERTRNRVKAVFVPWPELKVATDRLLGDLKRRRILLLPGPEGSGRFTAAIWLALQLQGLRDHPAHRIALLAEGALTEDSILDLLRPQKLRRDTVYLLRDASARGLSRRVFTQEHLELIDRRFHDDTLNAWLIVTTDTLYGPGLGPLVEVLPATTPSDPSPWLRVVLEKWFHWLKQAERGFPSKLETAIRQLDQQRTLLGAEGLRTASQVVRFLEKSPALLDRSREMSSEQLGAGLTALVRELAETEPATRAWFASLPLHTQFLALLVDAFRGVSREDLELIYVEAANRLRQDGGLIRDARCFAFDDLYRQINVRPIASTHSDDGDAGSSGREITRLEFNPSAYGREVRRQLRVRHHLLWDVVRATGSWVHSFEHPGQWRQRQLLGEAIARLGVHRQPDLEKLLETLAAHRNGTIASVPGWILRGIVQLDAPDLPFVLGTLEAWVTPKPIPHRPSETDLALDPDRLWAGVSAIWRVYAGMADRLREASTDEPRRPQLEAALTRLESLLTTVASATPFLGAVGPQQDFVSYAVGEMFRHRPLAIAQLIGRWLEETDSPSPASQVVPGTILHAAGLRATERLFVLNPDAEFLTAERFEALLSLLRPALQAERAVVDSVLESVLHWMRTMAGPNDASAPSLQPGTDAPSAIDPRRALRRAQIGASLIAACLESTVEARRHLRRSLMTRWLRHSSAEVREAGRRAIQAARLLDGTPVDLPGASWIAVLLDASDIGRENQTAQRLSVELAAYLQPVVDLHLVQLGNSRELSRPGTPLEAEDLASRRLAPRLAMPWLEKFQTSESRPQLGLIAHWEKLIDEGDIEAARLGFPVEIIPIRGRQNDDTDQILRWLGLAGKVTEENERAFESVLWIIEDHASSHLSRTLAGRTTADWWKLLTPHLDPLRPDASTSDPPESWARAESAMNILLAGLRGGAMHAARAHPGSGDPPRDLRIALGLVQCMASQDLARTVDWLMTQLKGPRRDPSRQFAAAAAILLIRANFLGLRRTGAKGFESAPPMETVRQLVRLGPALARGQDRWGILALLTAVWHWIGLPEGPATLQRSEALVAMFDPLRWRLRRETVAMLDGWSKTPLARLGETTPSAGARALGLRLRLAALRPSREPLAIGRVTLVVVHVSQPDPECRRRILDIAYRLYRLLQDGSEPRLQDCGFFLAGSRRPVAVAQENADRTAFDREGPTCGVVAPLFESLRPEDLGFAIVLADEVPCDLEESLAESHGRELAPRVACYWFGESSAPPGWSAIPTALPVDDAGRKLGEYLAPRLATLLPPQPSLP